MGLSTRLLTLRRSPILLKLPPYLSALCIIVGIGWLFLLPLDEYSRDTYISENAILPGQVHTYFGGSEHNTFRAYRQEIWDLSLQTHEERQAGLERVLQENGLKTATQAYSWHVAGEEIAGKNVYGVIQAPRADATEAMVLIAAWKNFANETNYSGVALALSLARYFKRWSVWSKDIIVLIPDDSFYGPEAWVSAYHSTASEVTATQNVSVLPLKAGALQAAVALDYPAPPWGQRFDKLDVLYDGINGALPNLDLLNTAVHIARTQLGLSCTLHGFSDHVNSYRDRLRTIGQGILTQGVGHATGPHSAFMPYHVDAITLRTIGDGWHDEISLGRATESLFRSINNLLEHFHQSFFFYILLSTHSFVSIANYLPAAMIVAGNFTITALALWIQSARLTEEDVKTTDPAAKRRQEKLEPVKEGEDVVLVPKSELEVVERKMLVPAILVLLVHLNGLLPLHFLTQTDRANLPFVFCCVFAASIFFPLYLAYHLSPHLSAQQILLTQCFSLLPLGATLSTLATLNFSLALVIGLLCAPLSFIRPLPPLPSRSSLKTTDDAHGFLDVLVLTLPAAAGWVAISPPVVLFGVSVWLERGVGWILVEMARGWAVQGVWTGLVVWGVWWPAWVVGGVVMFCGSFGVRV